MGTNKQTRDYQQRNATQRKQTSVHHCAELLLRNLVVALGALLEDLDAERRLLHVPAVIVRSSTATGSLRVQQVEVGVRIG